MLLLVLNQPATTYARQIIALCLSDCITSYDKRKIDECCVIMKVQAVKLFV